MEYVNKNVAKLMKSMILLKRYVDVVMDQDIQMDNVLLVHQESINQLMNVSKAVEQIKFLLVEFVVVKMDMDSIQIKSVLIV